MGDVKGGWGNCSSGRNLPGACPQSMRSHMTLLREERQSQKQAQTTKLREVKGLGKATQLERVESGFKPIWPDGCVHTHSASVGPSTNWSGGYLT